MEDSYEDQRSLRLNGFEGEAMEPDIMVLHAMLTSASFNTYSFPEVSIPVNLRELAESE